MHTSGQSELVVRPATMLDCAALAATMRAEDVAELAAVGHAPLATLTAAVCEAEQCNAVVVDGECIAMFGVSPHHAEHRFGVVWGLTSHVAPRHWRALHKLALSWLAGLHPQYDAVGNLVMRANTTHVRWLGRLGFIFINRHQINGHTFIEFARKTNVRSSQHRSRIVRGRHGGKYSAVPGAVGDGQGARAR